MNWLKTIGAEFVALFIDDGRFAVSIVVWVALLRLLLPHLSLLTAWHVLLLPVGLVAILLEGVLRRAGRR